MNQTDVTLHALVETLLPSDDGPGAAEAGVCDYVAAHLALAADPASQARVSALLEALDALETASFFELAPTDRDRVLRSVLEESIHAGTVRWLISLAVEGFLADPSHGGNREGAGWSYVGYRPRAEGARSRTEPEAHADPDPR